MPDLAWLFVVAGGPVVLVVAYLAVRARNRRGEAPKDPQTSHPGNILPFAVAAAIGIVLLIVFITVDLGLDTAPTTTTGESTEVAPPADVEQAPARAPGTTADR